MSRLPSPSVLLGIPPATFPSWYPGQEDAFRAVMDWYHSPSRFLGLSLPTGSGKTVLALLLARLSGARAVILTATKGLQDQYIRDARLIGGVNVKGQNNFACTLVPSLRADEGPCHEGMSCPHPRSGTCSYRAQLQRALDSQLVITNYAYYLAQTNYSSGLGDVGLLVADEGHLAFSALENHLTVSLYRMDVEAQGIQFPVLPEVEPTVLKHRRRVRTDGDPGAPASPDLWAVWRTWAKCSIPVVEDRVAELDAEVRGLRAAGSQVPGALSRTFRVSKAVLAKLGSVSGALGDWVVQRTRHGFLFTPRWVSGYGGSLFPRDVPNVVFMSAILSHKALDYLGVPSADGDRTWFEAGSYFPPSNTPVWHVPTTRVNYLTDDYGATLWQARIDQIIQRRLDRKGIVFTVSYDRARLLLSRSRFKGIMYTHSTADVGAVVDRFRAANPPAVLVSPSVTTGWDFPYDSCRYIVVGKVPYPDTRDPVTQARHEDDRDWSSYLAMDTLVQSSGRGTRAADDRCEVLAVDDNIVWFMYKYAEFAPLWFRQRYRGSLRCVPDPLV